MHTTRQLLILLAGLALASTAGAQSTFTGTWTGSVAYTSSLSCTTNGLAGRALTCSSSLPLSGKVDAQGNATYQFGAGTNACSNGTSPMNSYANSGGGTPAPIPANGLVGFPAVSVFVATGSGSNGLDCTPWSLQFTATPLGAAGAMTCVSR